MGFALIEQPPQRGKRGRGRGRGRRARDPVKTPGRTREERCLPELLSRLSLGKHAQKLKHLDYAGMKSVDQDDLETLGLDAEAAARHLFGHLLAALRKNLLYVLVRPKPAKIVRNQVLLVAAVAPYHNNSTLVRSLAYQFAAKFR